MNNNSEILIYQTQDGKTNLEVTLEDETLWLNQKQLCELLENPNQNSYDPGDEVSQEFFKTIQNKMHYAIHGKTAAEIVYERADSAKPHVGMTHFSGAKPRRQEASIAKNYLM